MTGFVVVNQETGRIESNVVNDQEQAEDYARQANKSHQTDAYVVREYRGAS